MSLRVLLLGPRHDGGSLPPYLDVLAAGLRAHGATVTRCGSSQIPYDTTRGRFWPAARLRAAATALADEIDPAAHDVIALHAGNLEYDQLVPALLGHEQPLPVVHHVHTLAPTLLREHSPAPDLQAATARAFTAAAGYIYFGSYARARLADLATPGRPSGTAWLPTTIPAGTVPRPGPALATALAADRPIISLYGYAAPWKDAALLLDAAATTQVPARIVLAGDFWDDPGQAGTDLRSFITPRPVGAAEVVVVPGYLDAAARLALVRASTAAVFPYRPHPSFQGSGAIADYLAHAVPVIATDTANMAELIGPAGHAVPAGRPRALAAALDAVHADGRAARAAAARASRFTATAHAARCLPVYRAAAAAAQARVR